MIQADVHSNSTQDLMLRRWDMPVAGARPWNDALEASAPPPIAATVAPSKTFNAASALVTKLEQTGVLAPQRAMHARRAIQLLDLWWSMPPTHTSDGSDGDITLFWEAGDVSASLSIDNDETLGYAYRRGLLEPWHFVGEEIGVAELNELHRILGVARQPQAA